MVVRCDEILDDYIIKAKITSYASITRNRAVDIIDKSIKLLEQSSQNSQKFDFGNFKENAVS